MTTLAESADLNLAVAWTTIGAFGGDADRVGNIHLYATGLPMPVFNGAIVTGPSADPESDLASIFDFMDGRGVPWVLWVRAGVDDSLVAAAREAGLAEQAGPPAMGLDQIPELPPLPEGLRTEVVTDAAGLDIHRDLMQRAFGMPAELVASLISDRFVGHETSAMMVGWMDAEPVSTAMVVMSGDTAGIYNVATPPEFQRRGLGAALTWAAVHEGVRRGASRSTLQASAAGLPVYERMGYVHLGSYNHLVGSSV